MDLLQSTGVGGSVKSFWQKPEGKTGLIVAAIVATFVGFGILVNLPAIFAFMTTLMLSTVKMIIAGVVVTALVGILLEGTLPRLVTYFYKISMRKLTGIFITIEPAEIARNEISEMKSEKAEADGQIVQVKGAIEDLDGRMALNDGQRLQSIEIMKVAREHGQKAALVTHARRAKRREKTNLTFQALRQRLELIYRALVKISENADLIIADKEDEVEQAVIEYETMKKAYGAWNSAMRVLKGQPDKLDMLERSLEFMTEDARMKRGEITAMVEMSRGFLQSIDLEQMVLEEGGLKMLEEWEAKADDLLLNPEEKRLLLAESTGGASELPVPRRDVVTEVRRARSERSALDELIEGKK